MGGIEYLDRKTDKWLAAGVEEGALYLNIADMMTRISNGEDLDFLYHFKLLPSKVSAAQQFS